MQDSDIEQKREARRLERLEQKHRQQKQLKIILAVLVVILLLSIILAIKTKRASTVDSSTSPDAELSESQASEDIVINIAAVGDIMMYDDQIDDAKQAADIYDFSNTFAAVSGYTISPDLTIGNLELNFCGAPYCGKPDYRAPEALASTLSAIGFDILQTANTYSIQNGLSGLQSTIRYLNLASIDHVGTYAAEDDKETNSGVLLKNINGVKIAFIAYTKGLNGLTLPKESEYAVDVLYSDYSSDYKKIDQASILESVDAAKSLKPDIIIAMLHWGSDGDRAVTDSQETIAKLLFENGVDAIIGSHSHVVGKMETKTVEYEGKEKTCFVAYSLGNFYSSMDDNYTYYAKESVILNLVFTKNGSTGETSITNITYTPLYILDNGEKADNRFEILPIRSAINSGLFPELRDTFTAAISHLRSNTESDFDSGH